MRLRPPRVRQPLTGLVRSKWEHYKGKTVPFTYTRWISLAVLVALYYLRVHILAGWYIVTYGLAIYLLNLFIGFLSPPVRRHAAHGPSRDAFCPPPRAPCAVDELCCACQVDADGEGPLLPLNTNDPDEYRPFTRRVGEFQFWFVPTPLAMRVLVSPADWSGWLCLLRYKSTMATCLCFFMTFFSVFNIPVFWPILLVYFITLFGMTMKRQIKHMRKYGYVPWSYGKKTYAAGGKKDSK